MTEGDILKVARAIARSDQIDFDFACPMEREPISGACDSSECVAAHWEDHEPIMARLYYRQKAEAAIRALRDGECA